jgi:DoxX-like protein
MHIAVIVLSVLLAVEFAATGTMKVLETDTARRNAAHLGISLRTGRLIGAAELAAAAGLLGGLAVKPLTVGTAAALILLMIGAIGSHLKAGDKGAAVLPAVITGLAAIALVILAVSG